MITEIIFFLFEDPNEISRNRRSFLYYVAPHLTQHIEENYLQPSDKIKGVVYEIFFEKNINGAGHITEQEEKGRQFLI